jgi:hypothetical protein
LCPESKQTQGQCKSNLSHELVTCIRITDEDGFRTADSRASFTGAGFLVKGSQHLYFRKCSGDSGTCQMRRSLRAKGAEDENISSWVLCPHPGGFPKGVKYLLTPTCGSCSGEIGLVGDKCLLALVEEPLPVLELISWQTIRVFMKHFCRMRTNLG